MQELYGEEWHQTLEGKKFLDYLATPSTVMYGVFHELLQRDIATSVYHMSGGAYSGKLARPLARHNLFVALENLFPPDWRELKLMEVSNTSIEDAYAKWPMGNDGFITTAKPDEVLQIIQKHNLEARIVGRLELARDGQTGVKIHTFKNDVVYFSGK